MTEPDYPLAPQLCDNEAIHCATLAIAESVVSDSRGVPHFARPDEALRSATLTFIRRGGRTYAITCWHVIEAFRDLNGRNPGQPFGLYTMLKGFFVVIDRFVQPAATLGQARPDVAILEINPDLVAHIGKLPIDLDTAGVCPEGLNHAVAVGFPEKSKKRKPDGPKSYQISMPHVRVIAGLSGTPRERFTMCSGLINPAPDIDYSGMSGGPIFWSTHDDYGLLGIIYEGSAGADRNSIYIFGELATQDAVQRWIQEFHSSSPDWVGWPAK